IALPIVRLVPLATGCCLKRAPVEGVSFVRAIRTIPNDTQENPCRKRMISPNTGSTVSLRNTATGVRQMPKVASTTILYSPYTAPANTSGPTKTLTPTSAVFARAGNEPDFLGQQSVHLSLREQS